MDITTIPIARDFIDLAVVLGGVSRRVLSRQVSITLKACFCIAAIEQALAHHVNPEIFNTDQGIQSPQPS